MGKKGNHAFLLNVIFHNGYFTALFFDILSAM